MLLLAQGWEQVQGLLPVRKQQEPQGFQGIQAMPYQLKKNVAVSRLISLDLTGLGVRVALHADRLARALASAGVGLGALTTHWQTAAVSDAAVAVDGSQALQMCLQFTAKVTFSNKLHGLNRLNDQCDLLVRKLARSDVRVDITSREDFSA